MAIDFAADLAVFFSPEDFGERITYEGVGEITVIWDRPTDEIELGDRRVPVGTNIFHLPMTMVPSPHSGATIVVLRTEEHFVIVGEPRLNRDGTIWACEAEPI